LHRFGQSKQQQKRAQDRAKWLRERMELDRMKKKKEEEGGE